MDQKEIPAVMQKLCRAFHKLRKPRGRFMSGDRFRGIGVGKAAVSDGIRRIAGHQIRRSAQLFAPGFSKVFYIRVDKFHALLQPVQCPTAQRAFL